MLPIVLIKSNQEESVQEVDGLEDEMRICHYVESHELGEVVVCFDSVAFGGHHQMVGYGVRLSDTEIIAKVEKFDFPDVKSFDELYRMAYQLLAFHRHPDYVDNPYKQEGV